MRPVYVTWTLSEVWCCFGNIQPLDAKCSSVTHSSNYVEEHMPKFAWGLLLFCDPNSSPSRPWFSSCDKTPPARCSPLSSHLFDHCSVHSSRAQFSHCTTTRWGDLWCSRHGGRTAGGSCPHTSENAIVSHFLDNYWTLGRSVGLSTIVSSNSSASWCLQFIPKEDANPSRANFEVSASQLAQVWEGVAL